MWAAIQLLLKDFDITCKNIRDESFDATGYDFVLGWGGFESPVERAIRELPNKKGLCIGGNAFAPVYKFKYDVLFYETPWYKKEIADHPNIVKAFGVNTNIFFPRPTQKIFDVITVGAFAEWKRHYLLQLHSGTRLAIGQIQRGNMEESMEIITSLLTSGVIVSDMVAPEKLAELYNASGMCYIPCNENGGGERAVLEARACGIPVVVEQDNEKLLGLLECEVPTEKDYAKALKKGIESICV